MTAGEPRRSRQLSARKVVFHLNDFYVRRVLQARWRRQGVTLGARIVWLGRPVLSVAPGSTMTIGEGCLICSRSEQTALGVNHPVVLRTLRPGAVLKVGSGVRMSGTTICAARSIVIGDRCVIGANVTIADTDFHSLDAEVRSSSEDATRASSRAVRIGNDVFVGGGSYILKGVTVGDRAVIGAASVVTQAVAAGAVVAGNPARVIGGARRVAMVRRGAAARGNEREEAR